MSSPAPFTCPTCKASADVGQTVCTACGAALGDPAFIGRTPIQTETTVIGGEEPPAGFRIPFGTLPENKYIRGPLVVVPRVGFFAFERVPDAKTHARELEELRNKTIRSKERIEVFRGEPGRQDRFKAETLIDEGQYGGYTVIKVLPELVGLPLSDLVFGWLQAVRPSCIRITRGVVNCDSRHWRVTVTVDENDVITDIEQEVHVWGGCGADMNAMLREAKTGEPAVPHGNVYGHTAGLERAEF